MRLPAADGHLHRPGVDCLLTLSAHPVCHNHRLQDIKDFAAEQGFTEDLQQVSWRVQDRRLHGTLQGRACAGHEK